MLLVVDKRFYPVSVIQEGFMKAEFTAIIEPAPEGGYWAICPEVPGANGEGETTEEAKNNLKEAIELILDDRRQDVALSVIKK